MTETLLMRVAYGSFDSLSYLIEGFSGFKTSFIAKNISRNKISVFARARIVATNVPESFERLRKIE